MLFLLNNSKRAIVIDHKNYCIEWHGVRWSKNHGVCVYISIITWFILLIPYISLLYIYIHRVGNFPGKIPNPDFTFNDIIIKLV